jgi:hypothetical protein
MYGEIVKFATLTEKNNHFGFFGFDKEKNYYYSLFINLLWTTKNAFIPLVTDKPKVKQT